MAKLVYKIQMTSDPRVPGLRVRSSTLPEELGGINYLLTDKTGTLTQNEMIFRKLHLGKHPPYTSWKVTMPSPAHEGPHMPLGFLCLSDGDDSVREVRSALLQCGEASSVACGFPYYTGRTALSDSSTILSATPTAPPAFPGHELNAQVGMVGSARFSAGFDWSGVAEIGVNVAGPIPRVGSVTPFPAAVVRPRWLLGGGGPDGGLVGDVADGLCTHGPLRGSIGSSASAPNKRTEHAIREAMLAITLCHNVSPVESEGGGPHFFQGASPDELALVQFAATCGLQLSSRTPNTMVVREPNNRLRVYDVLHEMPFSSELRRMGVLLRNAHTGQITFYMKVSQGKIGRLRAVWLQTL